MLKITKETDYALLIISFMATKNESLSATVIAQNCAISVAIASKILKLLTKAQLLTSTRGTNGGYSLARSGELITIADIITAIEGGIAINKCADTSYVCNRSEVCNLAPYWIQINNIVLQTLSRISIANLQMPLKDHTNANKKIEICFNVEQIDRP